MYKTIVVAVDFSSNPAIVIEKAVDVGKSMNADIHLVHVMDDHSHFYDVIKFPSMLDVDFVEVRQRHYDQLKNLGAQCAYEFEDWDACEGDSAKCYGGTAPPSPPSAPHFAHGALNSEDLLMLERLDSELAYDRHLIVPGVDGFHLHYHVDAGTRTEGGYIDFKLECAAIFGTAYVAFATEAPNVGGAVGVVVALDSSRDEDAAAPFEATVYHADTLDFFSHGKFLTPTA